MKFLKQLTPFDYITVSGVKVTLKLSYQTFGKPLNDAPIVLINHALTGNSNVAGITGWWNRLVGDHKTINTKHYTILAFNIPGNGFDQSEISTIKHYKDICARDIAQIFAIGLDKLGVKSLFAAIGGSVGGGIAWELAVLKPQLISHLIPIASDWKSSDWIIANCHIQDSILNHSSQPIKDARMHAMTLYRTPDSLKQKFNRNKTKNLFYVESWLNHHGETLDKRYELSGYKMMNQILKTIDITKNRGSFIKTVQSISSHIHIITIDSDLFFKAEENWDTYIDLKRHKEKVSIYEIQSIHGHDAFLIEYDQLSTFLAPIFNIESQNNEKNKYRFIKNS